MKSPPHGAEHDPHTVLPELCKISDGLLTDTEHGVPCAVSIAVTTRVAESTGQIIGQGINFIDTANRYAFGTSEEYIGQALRNLNIARDQVVLASKRSILMMVIFPKKPSTTRSTARSSV